jgi:cell division protein FtsB
MRMQIEQTEKENHELEQNVKALKSDPSAIERIARDEMGLAKPGEYIFKVPARPGEKDKSSGNSPGGSGSQNQKP